MNHVHSLHWNDTSGIHTCVFPCFSTFQLEENKQWSLYYRPKTMQLNKVEIPQNCHKSALFDPQNPGKIVIPDKSNKLNQPRRLHFMSEAGPAMKIWSTLTHGEGPGHAHWAKPNQRINLSELEHIQFIWTWWGCIKNQWIDLYIANEPPMLSMLKTFETKHPEKKPRNDTSTRFLQFQKHFCTLRKPQSSAINFNKSKDLSCLS